MNLILTIILGFTTAALGSLTPSFLNMTVVKTSLKNGFKPALFVTAGLATILFFQANIGIYLSNLLMENSEYITTIQKVGTVILILLSLNFLRLHFNSKNEDEKMKLPKSKAYSHGLLMGALNTIAIPFYFTSVSFLIGFELFEYSYLNSFLFSVGSTLGSFTIYSLYATIATRIEDKLQIIKNKMNLILALLTGIAGIANAIYLLID